MPIDYSKWDKIELSDDSDVEVHPNVDKRSFIRWKQRDIHEKRMQRNIEIKSIIIQLTMYAKLNDRLVYLLNKLSPSELLNNELVLKTLDSEFDPKEKFDYEKLIKSKGDSVRKGLTDLKFDKEEIENTPCYNEMIDDLFIQIKDDHEDAKTDGDKLIQYIKDHRQRIDDVSSKQTIKLDSLLNEKAQLITNEDLHTGFDTSFINKDKDEPKKETLKQTTIETINTPVEHKEPEKDILDELELLPETEKFGQIPSTDLNKSAEYLIKNYHICTQQQKDALVMTAFNYQLDGNSSEAKQIVHQSILLQYAAQLTGPNMIKDNAIKAVKLFFSKINDTSSPARIAIEEEVKNTFNHIVQRCEVIKNERNEQEGEELIQLRALDEGTELTVNLPEEGTQEYEIFNDKLPLNFQEALKTGSIDEVNNEFAKLKLEDAEKILEIFNECGVLGINGVLENEDQFQELQRESKSAGFEEHEGQTDISNNSSSVD
ncbi:unnamed protein product [Candida verbasci]|uniref:Hsp90 chaperone protein kinase-targeting subunit n=1 Tax=Candida verbasci TaxID=1227364 RepID=A0A9W4U1K7_9ASCO|nr:unnamed protein product [Candida verbasci]